jgi:hypothetical protein
MGYRGSIAVGVGLLPGCQVRAFTVGVNSGMLLSWKIAVHAVVGVPTLRAFLTEKYSVYLETHIKTPARQIQMIEHAFPVLLDKTLDAIEGFELEKWNSAELNAGMKPSTLDRKLSALRGVFSRAIESDILLTPSPMSKIKKTTRSIGANPLSSER